MPVFINIWICCIDGFVAGLFFAFIGFRFIHDSVIFCIYHQTEKNFREAGEKDFWSNLISYEKHHDMSIVIIFKYSIFLYFII